jgi:hypothetical protein
MISAEVNRQTEVDKLSDILVHQTLYQLDFFLSRLTTSNSMYQSPSWESNSNSAN